MQGKGVVEAAVASSAPCQIVIFVGVVAGDEDTFVLAGFQHASRIEYRGVSREDVDIVNPNAVSTCIDGAVFGVSPEEGVGAFGDAVALLAPGFRSRPFVLVLAVDVEV